MPEDGEMGGEAADPNSVVAQYQTTKLRTFMPSYKRIFQLTTDSVITLDPKTFVVTNRLLYSNIIKLGPEEKSDQFVFEADKTTFQFRTAHRSQLLCQLFECIVKKLPSKYKSVGPFNAERQHKRGSKLECRLAVAPYGIVEFSPAGVIVQEYKFVNVTEIAVDDACKGVFIRYAGRRKVFIVPDMLPFIAGCKTQLRQIGIDSVKFVNLVIKDVVASRITDYNATGTAVAIFDVNKSTRRFARMMPRQIHLTEEFVIEKDSSGFQYVSYHPVSSIYALVRSWTNPRELTIEYNNGTSRTFTCAVRDTLLAVLYDICIATGNIRVIVTGEVSDGLRLMPRFAEEDYQASITDAFFGASSIETWFLSRLSKACKLQITTTVDEAAIELACRELNANVPCPGIGATSDINMVKNVVRGVLIVLFNSLDRMIKSPLADHARMIAVLLQTIYRLLPSVAGYKCFVETREVDTRMLLLQLIQIDNDFVNYWALQVLTTLCKCPLNPRNMQQEFVNKHTLLSDQMINCLIELMSTRIDAPEESGPEDEAQVRDRDEERTQNEDYANDDEPEKLYKVAPNPEAHAHLAGLVSSAAPSAASSRLSVRRRDVNDDTLRSEEISFPNSLVIVGAAGLLESVLSSQRDTSSPELLHKVLDALASHYEVLVHMLRSNSLLILETAAILMFVLQKNRPKITFPLREMALSECLVLKNFHSAVFSPSANQRFISRFLVATWMSGNDKMNPAKALLLRLVPPGLIEYLKHQAITDELRKNLDSLEDDFYKAFGGASKYTSKGVSELQARMRARIANVLRDQNIIVKEVSATPEIGSGSFEQPAPFRTQVSVPAPAPIATPPTPSAPAPLMENYRIMFHMMTQDHKLPDFIWNEQTRSELRAMLDTEVRDFEQQQRLKGAHRIAWNYQQFSVRYDSLKEEVQIGFVYLRPFLEAGDTFIRSLINPSHLVLFEKLLRRVLVNADTNSKVSILCTKCLTRLYSVARDFIGEFDDMMLIIKILERSNNLEMQHCLIDLLEVLCEEPGNAVQFLDKEFVSVIMQYASLAHLNPDQIGNMLAQMTSKVLMLTDAVEGSNISGNLSSDSGLKSSGNTAAVDGAEEMVRTHRRSMWIPPDNLCPKVWFVAPKGSIPPPANKIRGPFRVSDLVSFFDEGQLDDGCLVAPSSLDGYDEERFDAVVDTGKWRAFNDYFQLRIQMLYPGKAMYTPAEISRKALHMLTLVSSLHKAVDSRKKPFYPVPQSKRIMSTTDHLVVLAQLLLSNDHEVVTLASQLLQSLVEYNPTVTSKLYLTGVFFFACRYAGNDFLPLAKLLDATHLRQSFHDASAAGREHSPASKSVLNSMLPFALINTLVNYGSERFSTVFTGVFDTPEVIWNAELRHQLVEMINLHLGDLLSRLRQFNMIRYDYCPIPTVYYQSLDKELYVYEYYLRNLCDEKRFPDYHILQPLQLFRECLERWREEMAKGVADVSVADSKSLLGLPGKYDNKDLRKAYKNLAKQYHPDKNAGGRDMFEKVQKAYELLSMVEAQAAETDLRNVLLLIKTQNIIYRRFPNEVSDQKYPGYTLLMDAMRIPPVSPPCTGIESEILSAGALLLYYTNSLSPLNAREFVKIGAVEKLQKIVEYALEAFHYPETKAMAIDILVNSMKAYTSVANFDLGRDTLMGMVPGFTNLLPKVLALSRTIPLATESCLEIISRCAIRTDLQDAIISSGVIWKMIPMLLGFDGTLQEDFSDESQRSVYNQAASNMHGVIAIKALGRLGGYMFDDLASPENVYVKTGLSQLLTAPLAKFLRNRRPWELLGALNENVESGTKIWNVGMRKELLHFVTNMDAERPPGSREDDLAPAMTFQYSCLKDELCIGGVYVRIFNRTGQTTDVEDPSQFARDLLNYVAGFKNIASPSRSDNEHQEFAIEGLHSLADAHKYIAGDVVAHPGGLDTVFSVLQRHQDSPSFASGVKLIHSLCESPEFISAAVKADPPAAWRLLQTICTTTSPHASSVWNSADFWAANPDGLGYLVDIGAVPHLMGVILGVAGYNSSYAFRLYAVQLLTKFLSNHLKGADASAMLRRFLPEPVVVLIKTRQGAACLQALDDVCENPELIWTAEMQGELRKDLTALLIRSDGKSRFQEGLDMPGDYTVTYRQLREEIYLGSVYVRLYLKQPTFRLSNAIFFAEKLVEFWESSFNTQVPLKAQGKTHNMVEDDGRALVLGKEDFLTLVTSCMAIVLKGEIAVIDYLLQWDFPKTLCDSLKRALDMERRGVPVTSIARLLNQLSTRIDVVDSLSVCRNDVILQLTRSLNLNSNMGGSQPKLPKEATLITEVLKKIYSSQGAHSIGHLVQCGIKAGLHNYLLDHVLSASRENLADVTFPTALHVHAVDVLKSMAALDESNIIRVLLENHPAWGEYKDQRHDLFISDAERSDPYLIKDATTASYYALLTDGSGDNKAASHFTSTTSAFTTAMPIFSETASKQEVAITKPAELTPAPVAAKQVVVSSNPTPVASSSAPTSASPPRSTSGAKTQLKTMVIKGAHGLGLDVAKSTLGVACIVGFKAMPEGVEHPCAKCDPQLEKYDVIVAVNKNPCPVFSDAVQALKGCPAGPILLTVERKV